MTMPNPPQTLSWRVTGQTERTRVGDDGSLVSGVQVSYQTGAGHAGTVFVPDALYGNTDYVRQQIAAAAAQSDAIGALSSDS